MMNENKNNVIEDTLLEEAAGGRPIHPAGTKVVKGEDGKVITIYPDGSSKTRYPDGTTVYQSRKF